MSYSSCFFILLSNVLHKQVSLLRSRKLVAQVLLYHTSDFTLKYFKIHRDDRHLISTVIIKKIQVLYKL